jgi:DNA-binding transcriptional ArsR family regulator
MRNTTPLDALFPRTRQGILAALFVHPQKSWYVAELARRMGVPSSSLQRELQELTDAGILKAHRQGRMAYFQPNTDSPLYPDLRGLMLKTAGLVDVLRDALEALADKIQLAFVYGSMAIGEERSDSDVDFMVVGDVSSAELALALRSARETLGREINPTVYSPAEFARKHKENDGFLARVMAKPRLLVFRNKNDLGETTSQP